MPKVSEFRRTLHSNKNLKTNRNKNDQVIVNKNASFFNTDEKIFSPLLKRAAINNINKSKVNKKKLDKLSKDEKRRLNHKKTILKPRHNRTTINSYISLLKEEDEEKKKKKKVSNFYTFSNQSIENSMGKAHLHDLLRNKFTLQTPNKNLIDKFDQLALSEEEEMLSPDISSSSCGSDDDDVLSSDFEYNDTTQYFKDTTTTKYNEHNKSVNIWQNDPYDDEDDQ